MRKEGSTSSTATCRTDEGSGGARSSSTRFTTVFLFVTPFFFDMTSLFEDVDVVDDGADDDDEDDDDGVS